MEEKLFAKYTKYMSRIGKKIVKIPGGVEVDVNETELKVKGPKGELTLAINPKTKVSKQVTESGESIVVGVFNEKDDKAIWGTTRALIANMVQGVTDGFTKVLELNGVGFRMDVQGSKLVLKLGFSHEIVYELPKGVDASIDGNKLKITGIEAQVVGQTAAEIRSFKKPEPYKGKGFKYDDEIIRRKVGKASKSE